MKNAMVFGFLMAGLLMGCTGGEGTGSHSFTPAEIEQLAYERCVAAIEAECNAADEAFCQRQGEIMRDNYIAVQAGNEIAGCDAEFDAAIACELETDVCTTNAFGGCAASTGYDACVQDFTEHCLGAPDDVACVDYCTEQPTAAHCGS